MDINIRDTQISLDIEQTDIDNLYLVKIDEEFTCQFADELRQTLEVLEPNKNFLIMPGKYKLQITKAKKDLFTEKPQTKRFGLIDI